MIFTQELKLTQILISSHKEGCNEGKVRPPPVWPGSEENKGKQREWAETESEEKVLGQTRPQVQPGWCMSPLPPPKSPQDCRTVQWRSHFPFHLAKRHLALKHLWNASGIVFETPHSIGLSPEVRAAAWGSESWKQSQKERVPSSSSQLLALSSCVFLLSLSSSATVGRNRCQTLTTLTMAVSRRKQMHLKQCTSYFLN